MSGRTWVVDSNRIATKIRSASGASDPAKIIWKSNPTKSCPNCQFTIDNSDVAHEWPGLPRGVKFDPSDQEIIWHLLAKVGVGNLKSHPFIDEFIPTVEEDDGICYTHPQNLPGVKQDGSVSHFFHRAIKAYNTGTRKRRKINGDDLGDVRWHKTGRTKPVILEGVQKGCKKIMVLYVSPVRGGKAEKTNWVMHQYHLGTEEDEKDGEYVISKVFYQKQVVKLSEKSEEDVSEGLDAMVAKVDPVTPKSATPEARTERRHPNYEVLQEDSAFPAVQNHNVGYVEDEVQTPLDQTKYLNYHNVENHDNQNSAFPAVQNHIESYMEDEVETPSEHPKDINYNNVECHGNLMGEDNNDATAGDDIGWDNDSQFLLSSQQLVEGLSLCDEFLQSQSPNRDENENGGGQNGKPRLSDYARLGPEDLKRDLEECQNLDPANIDIDTPPDFRLSQLEFESQDSYIAWGGSTAGGKVID